MPRRLLPARALVIALSPLLDERGIGALLDLRARGYDLVVLEISPVADARRPDDPSLLSASGGFSATRCAPGSRRSAFRSRIWESPRTGVELAIEEVITLRRHARPVARV